MTEASASRESFELALQSHLEEARRERISQFSPDMLAWLALPPQWSGRLARQAGFPGWDAAFLDAAMKEGLCARTRASLADQAPWYAAEVGARLAAYLPAGTLPGLLEEVAAIEDQHARARILATMTRSLPPSLLARASQIAESLPDPGARTRALLGVCAAEPPAQAAATARRALSVAMQLSDPGDRAETLLLVAGQGRLDDEARRELGQAILVALPALVYESERGTILARAAPYLGPELAAQALEAALALQAAECRIEALAGLTRQLPEARAVALLRDQIAAVTTIMTEIGRRRAARTLARRLADYGAADLANSAALTLADEGGRAAALQAVAGALASAGDSRQAAEATATVVSYGQDRLDQVSSLSTLARTVAGDRSIGAEVAGRARQAATALAANPANAQALVSLATALVRTDQEAITVGERALAAIAGMSGAEDRYQLYRRLCTEMPDPLASRAAELALTAAQGIASLADRVEALTELAAHLAPELRQVAVREARALAVRETDFSFWMPEPARTEVLSELGLRYGPTFLHSQMIQIAGAVRTSSPEDPVSPTMARWAELATHGAADPAQAAAWLDQRLAGLTADGESGQALAWAGTGKLLVPVLGQELDSVVSVGLRRIELLYRRSLDLGHLQRFVARQEQIEEFWRLVDGDGTSWAVHYLGAGGLGKTMLLRQVTARLAPERGIPTARVDFDHLSPDYPIARPGQLLLELLDELQSFVTSGQADSFAYSFRAQVAQLHAPVTQGSNDPLARIHDEQFSEVLQTFCDFLRLLPQPVVLILDTCEELARRRAEGSTLPPVEATFEILERLHEEIPWLRVIFAGRRLLARSGPGWSVSTEADAEGHALLPERKDFLALHEMRGFSRDEVTGYLAGAAPGLSARMTEAIMARSVAPASAAPIVWKPPRPHDAEQRYNPFDVNLYANWAREDPSLRAETIAQGTTDPYIAIRIVRRLGQTDLDRLLPAVTLLGRFDRSMLRGELPGSDERFENAYYELSSQEWIDYQPDASLNTTFLEVERNLRPRLRSYYRNDPDRYVLLSEAQDRLGPALARLVEDWPLNQIGVDLVDAAMRLLPPADAALLWDKVSGQIRTQGDWPWADQRTSRLLGEDGAVADPGHPARAAVLASRISALIHTRSEYNPAPDWREVAEHVASSPDPAVREWLRCRAIAGLVAAFRLRGVELSADDLAAFWELVDQFAVVSGRLPGPLAEQLAASCCAALEALVEVAEMRGDSSLVSDIPLIERWLGHIAGQVPPDLLTLGTMIAARGQALHGRFEAALELAARAEESSADLPVSRPGRWADFDAPAMVSDRIRLELVRMAAALPVPADPLLDKPLDDWQRSAEANLGTIDADRLLAAILLRRLAAGILPRNEVTRLAALEEQATERVRRSPRSALWCHLAVPPLFTAVAWAWNALGQSDRAIELLNARRRRALAAGDDDAENAALTATLEISRRMRITQPVLAKNSATSADAGQQAAVWALTALTESPGAQAAEPVSEIPDACLHDWWRTHPVPFGSDSADARRFRRRAEQIVAHRGDLTPFAAFSLALDLAEADIAARTTPDWQAAIDPLRARSTGQFTAEQVVRVRLRAQALGHPDLRSPAPGQAGPNQEWIERVGLRRAAELAMDEGELLALRLPREAVPLLDLAAGWFNVTGDPAGALFAAIAATLARQRARMAVPPDLVQFLNGAYERVAGQGAGSLSAWADLAGQRGQRGLLQPRRLEPTMGGWLPRLAACLARGAGAGSADRRPGGDTQVRNMLEASLGSVPAELDPSVLARRSRWRLWRAIRRTPHSRWWWFFRITFGIFAVGIVVAIALAVFKSLVPSLNKHKQSPDIDAAVDISLIALLIAAGGVPVALMAWTLVRGRARRWAKAVVGLRITPSSGTGAADGDIRVDIEKWQTDPARLLPWKRPEPTHLTDRAVLPPLRAYERSAAALPASLQDGLRELARLVGHRSIRVSLDIDPALERMPWEALLSHPVLTGDSALPGALDFWRHGEPLAGTGRPRRAEPPGTVAVLADSTRRLFAERAGLAPSVSFPDLSGDDVNRAIERASALATDPPDIVLVIGRPVRMRGAVLLQTAEQVTVRGTSEDDLHEAIVGGGLLEPQVVAGLRGQLFIVLGAPGETGGRFDTERRDTADLRGWAADVFRAGAATVIMLPSMNPERAEAVLKEITSRIRKGITADAVYGAVRAARISIGTPAQPETADGPVEQALDICLFRRDHTPAFAILREQEPL